MKENKTRNLVHINIKYVEYCVKERLSMHMWWGISNDAYLGNSLVLHCASLLRTIFASLAQTREHVRVQNVRDFPQTKPDSEKTAPFLSNEHGDPRFFF